MERTYTEILLLSSRLIFQLVCWKQLPPLYLLYSQDELKGSVTKYLALHGNDTTNSFFFA